MRDKSSKFILFLMVAFCCRGVVQAQSLAEYMTKLDKTENENEKITLLKKIGVYYQNQKAFAKSQEYFEKALKQEIDLKVEQKFIAHTRENIAYCQIQQQKYQGAIQSYEVLLGYAQNERNRPQQIKVLNELSYLHTLNKNFDAALNYTRQVQKLHEASNNHDGIVHSYNNLGYLYHVKGDNNQSLASYQKAVDLSIKYAKSSNSTVEKATLFTNIGVAYTHLRDYKTANRYFGNALRIYEKTGDRSKQAKVYNFQAANHYVSGKTEAAINTALKSADIAKSVNDQNSLLESYQILAEAYQQLNDLKESQKYLKLYQGLQNKIVEDQQKKQQKVLQDQIEIEKKENELKQLLADKARQDLALKQSKLEKEKQAQDLKLKEQQLSLLKRNQELQLAKLREQKLEKDRVQQLLQLSEQKTLAEKRKREVERQALLTEKERIEKEKERAEKETQLQARNALEKQSALQKKQLAQERDLKRYGIFIIALGALFMIFIIVAFIGSQRARKKLKSQYAEIDAQKNEIETQHKELQFKTEEIEAQNEELHQNQEELMAQREFIDQKNVELVRKNKMINSSINVAFTIQQAILPYEGKIRNLLKDYFFLYRPKDVVSGDFYWLNHLENKTILVVADCTGHGVPGAFMTLIGNTLLDKIVRVWKIVDPAKILDRLHEEIQIVLRQEETKNTSGMDVVVLSIEPHDDQHQKVIFAGAKNPLYYSIDLKDIEVIKGDRKAIGGLQPSFNFTSHEVLLPKGSLIYAGSDGLQDQNNRKRRVLGSKNLIAHLKQNMHLPLSEQHTEIEKMLERHMLGTTQRDDILFMGMRL